MLNVDLILLKKESSMGQRKHLHNLHLAQGPSFAALFEVLWHDYPRWGDERAPKYAGNQLSCLPWHEEATANLFDYRFF